MHARLEGDFWTIASSGRVVRLKDSKGLHYLLALVQRPGQEVHVWSHASLPSTDGRAPMRLPPPTFGPSWMRRLGDLPVLEEARLLGWVTG